MSASDLRKQTESEKIKKALTKLRDFGHIVMNFNNRIYNNPGIRGHLDWEIYSKRNAVYIESKIGRDTPSDEQKKVMKRLAYLMGLPNSRIYVTSIKTGKEAEIIADRILKGEL